MIIKLQKLKKRIAAPCLFLPVFEKEKPERSIVWGTLTSETRRLLIRSLGHHFVGKLGDVHDVFLQTRRPEAVVFLGLGERSQWTMRRYILMVRKMIVVTKQNKEWHVAIPLEDIKPQHVDSSTALRILVEAVIMANYGFHAYKERPRGGWPAMKEVDVITTEPDQKLERAIRVGTIVANAVSHCRDLANTPGGDMTPTRLAEDAVQTGKTAGCRVKVLEEKEMKRLGMGGILGVSRGSAEKSKFIIMEYRRGGASAPIVFVGKGVTFDTGGINIKPHEGMMDMYMDMSGGAAVIAAMGAIMRLKLKANVIGLVPAVENMPSGSGYRPGDLLKSMSGKTIEVKHTDAEGRIILADALTYASRYKPSHVIDVATLTGAAMVALGQHASALFTSDDKFAGFCQEVGEASGDYVWRLPLWEEYEDEVKGTFGDVSNIGKTRYGGAITGAMFIKQFVGKYKWAHLDIAPTMTAIESQNLPKGASGVGVRFLVRLAERLQD